MDKETVLKLLDFGQFYKNRVPSLKLNGKKQAMGLCPFHNDKTPSLSVNIDTGFYNCFACNESGDVFTFYQKQIGVDFKTALKEIGEMAGVKEQKRKVVATFQYKDVKGDVLYIKERIEPGRNGRKKEFIFRHMENGKLVTSRGCNSVPYNLHKLVPAYYTVIVEGEAKVELLTKWDITGTCLDSGAQSPWKEEYFSFFKKKETIVILPDNDEPGRQYASRLMQVFHAKNMRQLKVINLPGLGKGEDILDWAEKEGNDKDKLMSYIHSASEWDPSEKVEAVHSSETWQEPVPLGFDPELPIFPIESLPDTGRSMVEAIAEVNQVDAGLPASIYLSVLSICLARKLEVDLSTHREPVNLYTCAMMGSGERKSATANLLTAPIYEYQQNKVLEMKSVIAEATGKRRIDEARLARLQKDAANDNSNDSRARDDAMELAKEMEENPVPNIPVYIADDITSEALGVLLAENGERLGIMSTEGGIFGIMAGRYQEKQDGNFDIYLKAHSGDPWSSHRIGREAKSVISPALTMGLTVQHNVLQEIGKNKRFRGRGLLARFLYAVCRSSVGSRVRHAKRIDSRLVVQYRDHVHQLMDISTELKIVALSPDAQQLWDRFYDDTEAEMQHGGTLEEIKDWGSKLPGAVARIAGLLHVAQYGRQGLDEPISADIVNASITIGTYYKEHALSAFRLMQLDSKIEAAKKILGFLIAKKPASFKGRDLLAGIYSFKDMAQVNSGLQILLEREYLREAEKPSSGSVRTGRPSAKLYEVNPNLYKNHQQYQQN